MIDATIPKPSRGGRPTHATRCERLRNRLHRAGYPRVAAHVAPYGDSVPPMFTDPVDEDRFVFALRPSHSARVGGNRILVAVLDGRAIASEDAILRVRPPRTRDLPPDSVTTVQIRVTAAVRVELERAARRADVTLGKHCAGILKGAALVEEERRKARTSPIADADAGAPVPLRESIVADPDLGVLSDKVIADRYGCTRQYVMKVRKEQ